MMKPIAKIEDTKRRTLVSFERRAGFENVESKVRKQMNESKQVERGAKGTGGLVQNESLWD